MLTRGMVERRAQAGAEVSALVAALAKAAEAMPAESYAFVVVPDRIGSIPFRAQCTRRPDVAARAAPVFVATTGRAAPDEVPRWPQMLDNNIIGRLKSEPLEDVTANPQKPGATQSLALPGPLFLLEPQESHGSSPSRSDSSPGFRDWNEVWARGPRRRGLRRMIALNDLRAHHAPLAAELEAAMARVHARGWYILGPEVAAFEHEFAAYVGAAECVAVANGTDALELALRALAIGPGDAVATVANAGMYSTTAIRAAGATPAYVEIDASTLQMDPAALAAALTPRTRALIVTHLYGRFAHIDLLGQIARERGVALIEDCAQAHGARIAGGMAGSHGRLGCFSFYPTKNLGALGDAGAIVTGDRDLASRLRALRNLWLGHQVPLHDGRRNELADGRAAGGGAADEAAAPRWLESPPARGSQRATRLPSAIPPSRCRRLSPTRATWRIFTWCARRSASRCARILPKPASRPTFTIRCRTTANREPVRHRRRVSRNGARVRGSPEPPMLP
jgi:hypothetical protein